MLYDNRMNRRRLRAVARPVEDSRGLPTARARPAAAIVLVILAAVLCAAAMSWMYMRYLLAVEAARESRFVNGVVQESSLHRAFFGRAEDELEQVRMALQRPDLRSVVLVSAGEAAPAAGGEPASARVARALRGEGVAETAYWRWSIPLRPSLWRDDPDAGPSLEFAVPVFSPDGSAVIGAALLRRSSSELSPVAGRVINGIWLAVLGGSLVLYGLLLFGARGLLALPAGTFASVGHRVATLPAWRSAEAGLRREAVRRGVRVESFVADRLPPVAGNALQVAEALEALVMHALARAADGALLQFSVRALRGSVEFSYAVAQAGAMLAGEPVDQDTRTLVRTASSLGGSMFLVVVPGAGLRAVLTLPA